MSKTLTALKCRQCSAEIEIAALEQRARAKTGFVCACGKARGRQALTSLLGLLGIVVVVDPDEVEPARQNNPDGDDLRAKAEAWLEGHPEVYALFERFALEMATHSQRFGVNLLRERVRWECTIRGDGDGYKFNNNHSPYIARKLVQDHPQLAPLLRFRETKY